VYTLQDTDSGSTDPEATFGLIRSDGTWKPAAYIVRDLATSPATTPAMARMALVATTTLAAVSQVAGTTLREANAVVAAAVPQSSPAATPTAGTRSSDTPQKQSADTPKKKRSHADAPKRSPTTRGRLRATGTADRSGRAGGSDDPPAAARAGPHVP
jgi:hypothetical protein